MIRCVTSGHRHGALHAYRRDGSHRHDRRDGGHADRHADRRTCGEESGYGDDSRHDGRTASENVRDEGETSDDHPMIYKRPLRKCTETRWI